MIMEGNGTSLKAGCHDKQSSCGRVATERTAVMERPSGCRPHGYRTSCRYRETAKSTSGGYLLFRRSMRTQPRVDRRSWRFRHVMSSSRNGAAENTGAFQMPDIIDPATAGTLDG